MNISRVQRGRAVAAAALAAVSALAGRAEGQLASFAGAQGFGGDATGGRAGSVYVVTNLNDSGAGSFRDAVSHSNRIVVFGVGGYVNLQSAVSCASNLTILGQTAPGQGIGFMGREVSFDGASNDIVQYIRAREGSGDPAEKASINLGSTTNVILDHVDAEYSQYDNIDAVGTNGVANLTIQNSLLADPIKAQQFNMHTEGTQVTYLNNLWVNAHNRNPLAKSNTQYVNNVVYNYQGGYTASSGGTFSYDILDNYFIAGPSTTSAGDAFFQLGPTQRAYSSGNLLDSNKNGSLSGSTITATGATVLTAEYSPETQFLPTLTATQAYAFTMAHAGDLSYNSGTGTFASRDEVDTQIAAQVASLGTAGSIYNTEADTGLSNGGFGTLSNSSSPANTLDTVPFAWLIAHGLSTTNAAGLLLPNPLGYAMVEQYAQQVQDQYATQVATSGDWTTTTRWSTATPGIYDHAQVRGNGFTNGTVTVSGTDAAQAFTVSVGGTGPAAGENLIVSGGTLAVQDTIYLGDQNNGNLTLSGGTVRANNLQLGNTVYDANGNPTSYTGTFNFTGGTLQAGQVVLGAGTPGHYTTGGAWNWNGGILQALGTLNVNAPATLTGTGATVNTTGPDGVDYNGTMSGVLSGTGGLTQIGGGTLTLSAVNTYSGSTTINNGAIAAAVTNAISPGSTITVTTVGTTTAGQLILGDGVTISSPLVIGGKLSSEFVDAPGTANATYAGSVRMSGGGAQYRVGDSGTGTITFTGPTTTAASLAFVTKGNITFAAGGTLNDTAGTGGLTIGRDNAAAVSLTVTGTGSAVNVPNVPAGTTGLTMGSGSTSYENPTVTVNVANGGAINVGAATVDLDNDPLPAATATVATLNLNAGGTLTAGALVASQAGTNLAALNLNGGTLVAGASDPAGGTFLPAITGLAVKVGSGGATVNSNGNVVTIAQPLLTAGGTDGGFTKTGSGTLTLTGANTYTGPTKVSAGTLLANTAAGSATGTGAVTVSAGATLGGTGTIAGAVTVNGTITAGDSGTGLGTLTTTAAQTWAPGGTFAAQVGSTGGAAPTVAGNDRLVMSNLSVSGPFAVTVAGTGSPTLSAGTVLVLANDKDTAASTNPFASSAVLSKLTLTATGVQPAGGYRLALATQADTLGSGGYDLVLTDVAATPEPTSLLLFTAAAAPFALGRRRR